MSNKTAKNQYLRHYVDQARQHIQPVVLIDRLVSHVLGEHDMSPSQVTAALGLIKKVLPDITAIDMSVLNETGPETLKRIERVIVSAVQRTNALPGEIVQNDETTPETPLYATDDRNWLN